MGLCCLTWHWSTVQRKRALPNTGLMPSSSSSSNSFGTHQVISKICIARSECFNVFKCRHTNTVWSCSKASLPWDQIKPTFNLRFKSCKQFVLVLIFIACSLTEISKINGSINLQHQTDKERKRNITLSWHLICSAQAASSWSANGTFWTLVPGFACLPGSFLLFRWRQLWAMWSLSLKDLMQNITKFIW